MYFGYEVLEDGIPIGKLIRDTGLWYPVFYTVEYTLADGEWIPIREEDIGYVGYTTIVEAIEEFRLCDEEIC